MNSTFTSNFNTLLKANTNRFARLWRDLRLARKLLTAFGFLSILALVVGILSYWGLNKVQGSFEKALSEGQAMATISQQMQSDFLTARQHEKDFLLGWQSQGFETAYKNYVVPYQGVITELHKQIRELSDFAPIVESDMGESYTHEQYEADIALLSQNVNLYQQGFEKTVKLIQERGFQDAGLEGQFRDKVHNIEDQIYDREGLEQLVITMLQIRRREKDYLLRGDQEYIDNVHELVAQLKDQTAASELLETTEKSEITALADQYLVSFDALVEKDVQIGATIEEFQEATHTTEPLVEKLAVIGAQLNTQDIATARTSGSQTLLFSTVTLITAVVVAVLLSVALSQQLSEPIQQLTDVAQQIEKGNFEVQADAVSHDEIGMLASAFNNMSTQLKNTLDGLEQTIADRTKALATSTKRLEILHEIDRSLLSARSPREIAEGTLKRIRQLISCPRASVSLFDLSKNEARFLTADFDGEEMIAETPITLQEFGQRIVDELQQNKPWLVNDILKDPQATELDKRLAEQSGIHAWLCLPLIYQGQLIGALNLGRGLGNPFTREDAEIAHDTANQLAIAIQHINLYNALQKELMERKKLISELEANNAELERFTYTVSHDLRNPLVTIKGFLGMLQKDIGDGRKDRIASDFQRIANAADKMDELLSDLLELSRVGRIINQPEEIDFVKLTKEAVELLDARIRSKNVTVSISPDLPTIFGDRIRLREVMENLIDNAAKYTDKQSNPIIEIGASQKAGDQIIFVRDNGMGIESQHLKKIFNLFEKLDQASEGTGIGLALIKRIIETHGGKIWVESDGLEKGSTFYFTIPDGRK